MHMQLKKGVVVFALAILSALAASAQVIVGPQLKYSWTVTNATTTGQVGSYIAFTAQRGPTPVNHTLSWTVSGTTPSACAFSAEGSGDGVSWYALDATGISCTASSNEVIASQALYAFRINLTSWTAGDSTSKVVFSYAGASGAGGTNNKQINVTAPPYNATGNGATDDTAAVASALAQAARTGSTLYMPTGTYKVTSGIVVTSPSNNFAIAGDGYFSRILFSKAAGIADGLTLSTNTNAHVGISGVRFSGDTSSGGVGRCITLEAFNHVSISGAFFDGCASNVTLGAPYASISIHNGDDIYIENNHLTANGPAAGQQKLGVGDIVSNWADGFTTHLHITANRFWGNNTVYPIGLSNAAFTSITDNDVDQGNHLANDNADVGYGILDYFTGAVSVAGFAPTNVTIANNRVTNTAGSGIYLQTCSSSCVINGNVVTNTVQQEVDTTLSAAAIALIAGYAPVPISYNVTINGNTIDTSGQHGISLSNTNGVVIQGNGITNCLKSSIRLRGPEVGTTIAGNAVTGSGRQILIDGAATFFSITGNSLKGRTGSFGALASIEFPNSTNAQRGTIAANFIEVTQVGVFIGLTNPYIAITGNTFNMTGTSSPVYAIRVASDSPDILTNTIRGIGSSSQLGIYLNSAIKANVVGNSVFSIGGAPLIESGTDDRIIENKWNGVQPTVTSSTRATFRGNKVSASGLSQGSCTLVAGTCTVSTTEIFTGDVVTLTYLAAGGVQGSLSLGTITNATSFVVNSSNAADTSTVFWQIVH
jgi:parallel beta-helix repeat protein